ncbi:MAG TPA: ribonuclease HII [Rudaea sp.]|jgi:ribonuclease HII
MNERPLLTAGVDEAGRGPLAGPVVVAAVILDPLRRINGLADSKVLSARRRETLDVRIRERAIAFSVVAIDVADIDRINIFQATMLGMARALALLAPLPQLALIDGNHVPRNTICSAQAIVDGDALERAISAASILAKVARDRIMVELDARFPGYGFAQHKGYSTPEHFEALRRLGPCCEHRRSFAPVVQAELPLGFC